MAFDGDVSLSFNQDETVQFTVTDLLTDDDTPLPLADYSFQYAAGCQDSCWRDDYGWGFRGSPSVKIDQTNGITVDTDNNDITFNLGLNALRPGLYRHECRYTYTATGEKFVLFMGQLTITRGLFNGAST